MMTTEHLIKVKGCDIHYWLAGPGMAPLVVLTHGAGLDHRTWVHQVPSLAKQFQVLAWDVRGHGKSQPIGKFSIPEAAADLVALLDHLGCEKAIIVGLSMGGYITQELAFRYPQRVKALVIVGSTPIAARYPLWEKVLLKWSTSFFYLYPWEPMRRWMARFSACQKDVQQYALGAFSSISRKQFITIWKAITVCLHEEPGYRIKMPCMLTHGEFDKTGTIRKWGSIWASQEPCCEYTVIPGAGHIANQDNPEYFNSILLSFLDKLNYLEEI